MLFSSNFSAIVFIFLHFIAFPSTAKYSSRFSILNNQFLFQLVSAKPENEANGRYYPKS